MTNFISNPLERISDKASAFLDKISFGKTLALFCVTNVAISSGIGIYNRETLPETVQNVKETLNDIVNRFEYPHQLPLKPACEDAEACRP